MAYKKNKYKSWKKERVWCSTCQDPDKFFEVWERVVDITCGDCFALEINQIEGLGIDKSKDRVKFERGWNLKKRFVAPDGTVYAYGKKISEKKSGRNSIKSSKKT